MESTISETHGERESSKQTEQPRTSRKRKQGDRTASSSLSSADHTRKSRKVAVEYSTDETDEDKIPDMEEGMAFPQQMKTVKLTLPATPSQVHLARSFCGMVCLPRDAAGDTSCFSQSEVDGRDDRRIYR